MDRKEGEWYLPFWFIGIDRDSKDFTTAFSFSLELGEEMKLTGNYFATEESAERMARKLRAVLNGADVIEMPSEEEINEKASELYPSQYNEYVGMYEVPSEKLGFGDCIDWLKSKIVK